MYIYIEYKEVTLLSSPVKYSNKMSNKDSENNNNQPTTPTNSIIYKFEHGERLKAEREAKERQRALFAKKMAKFGEGSDDQPKSPGAVNQKAKMFVEIANKDPEKERAERERKEEFQKKKLGFQEGSVPCQESTVSPLACTSEEFLQIALSHSLLALNGVCLF